MPVNVHENKSKTKLKGFKRDKDSEINPEFVEEIKKLEKEPIVYVKDLRKHFKEINMM